jgi:hypothetical protein
MPPLVILALGTIGAVLAGRWLAREARRVNADIDRVKAAMVQDRASRPNLRRDPKSGVYRPQ